MEKYSLDTVCTGNYKADHINSRIMELADDIATSLAQKDWEVDDRAENFYVEEENGEMRLNGDAQEIFDEYYDEYVDILYKFVNKVLELDSKKSIYEVLEPYISGDHTEEEVVEIWKLIGNEEDLLGDHFTLIESMEYSSITVKDIKDQL